MKPFDYARAGDLADAVSAVSSGGRPIAGGTNLIDLMKLEVETPERLIDLGRLPFTQIEPEGDGLSPPSRMASVFGAYQLMMQSTISFQLRLQPPHVFLRPPVNHVRVLDFLKAKDIFDHTAPVKDDLKRAIDAIHLAAGA